MTKKDDSITELELLKLNVQIWEQVIDVQKHFNDLEMKIRNYAILIISAFMSAIGLSLKLSFVQNFIGYTLPTAAFIAIAATISWLLFYFMDVFWYHPLLIGAVKHGSSIEKEIEKYLPSISLTSTISRESSRNKFMWYFNLRSTHKAHLFYCSMLMVLIFLTGILFCSGEKHTTSQEKQPISIVQKALPDTTSLVKAGVVQKAGSAPAVFRPYSKETEKP